MARKQTTESTETETKSNTHAKGKGSRTGKAAGSARTGKASRQTTRESKKSNIPIIKRPRSITLDTYNEYTASAAANFEHRIKELEALYADSKCPHKAIQHMRSMEKEWQYFTKRILPLIKPRRKQTDKKNNILMKQVEVSPKLAKFLKLGKGEKVSRSECNTAITMYVNIKDLKAVPAEKKKWVDRMNPGGKRCLQSEEDGSVINPDAALSELLDYEGYKARVEAGEHYWHRKNKETGVYEDIQEKDPKLTYSVVQHLLAPHFPKSTKAASAPPAAAKKAPAKLRGKGKAPAPEVVEESEAADSSSDSGSEE